MSIELSQELVACPAFRWMPGMSYRYRQWDASYPDWARVSDDTTQIATLTSYRGDTAPVPNLDDPATRGCVLHLVRELWKSLGATHVWVEASLFSHWAVWFPGALGRDDHATGETEMHALVTALKAGHRAKLAAI